MYFSRVGGGKSVGRHFCECKTVSNELTRSERSAACEHQTNYSTSLRFCWIKVLDERLKNDKFQDNLLTKRDELLSFLHTWLYNIYSYSYREARRGSWFRLAVIPFLLPPQKSLFLVNTCFLASNILFGREGFIVPLVYCHFESPSLFFNVQPIFSCFYCDELGWMKKFEKLWRINHKTHFSNLV